VWDIKCDAFAVSAEFLAVRIPELTPTVADGLVDALRHKSFLVDKGFMK
jgi:hypothetical protein